MPLPGSGQISADDINTELGNSAGTTVDFDDVFTNDFSLSRPHGMDELYGLSAGDNFAFSDWDGVVSITEFGIISATLGNAASRTINTSNFGAITSTTTQTVSVTITAPSTFNGQPVTNAGSSLTDNVSVTQQAVGRYLDITAADESLEGTDTSVQLTINDIYYPNTTAWTLSYTTIGSYGLGLSPYTVSGTGDDTRTLNISENTSGNTRQTRFTVTSDIGSKSDFVDVTQASYTPIPAPTISIQSVSPSGPYSYNGESGITFTVSSSTGVFSATIGPLEISPTFPTNQPSGITRNDSLSLTSTSGTTFYVDVPARSDGQTDTRSAYLTVSTSNAGGSASDSFEIQQVGLVTWNTNVSSLSFAYTGGTQTITLNTNLSWTASVSGTGFSINTTSGTSGTNYISVTSLSSDDSSSGTVTFSASGQSDIVVSLSKAAAPTEYTWFFNGSSQSGTSITLTPNTISTSYSFGLYGYRGSTPVATTWMLQRTSGTWIDAATTTSGTTSFATATSGQNTNGTPYLYLNIETNTGSARSGQAEITVDGVYVATIYVNQDGVSGGSGGGDPSERPDPGDIE